MKKDFYCITSHKPRETPQPGGLLTKIAPILFMFMCLQLAGTAQPNITRVEYYVDADPGYGKATPVTITPGTNLDGLAINISLTPLSQGVHVAFVRSKDANGAWSTDHRYAFLKPYTAAAATILPKVKKVEYYIDADPGFGKATPVTVTPGTDLTALSFIVNMAPLATGVHVVYLRSQDSLGAWSTDHRYIFLKPYAVASGVPLTKIKKVEYYVDADPGYSKATAVTVTPATDLASLSFNVDMAPLAAGVHVVFVRSQDSLGAWSTDHRWIFLKPYATTAALAVRKIKKVEYYVDTDPGYGKATAVTVTPATDLAALSFNINMAPLTQGVHIAFVRSQDSTGAWSTDHRWIFLNPYTAAAAKPLPKIKRVEYYLDADPGYGKGTSVAITAGTDLTALSFNIDMTPFPQGVHILFLRSQDSLGAWSTDHRYIFLKPYVAANAKVLPKIKKVEYYIDKDPGYGKATAVPITAGVDLSALTFSISTTPLTTGVHVAFIRSQDSLGAWSTEHRYPFLKPYIDTVPKPPLYDTTIFRIEYYVDVDPGYGKAYPVVLVPGPNLTSQFPIVGTLSVGKHVLGIRSKDENGAYSFDNKFAFTITAAKSSAVDRDVQKITLDNLQNSLTLQSNPVHQQAVLLYNVTKDGKAAIRVFDNFGNVVITKEITAIAGINVITLETARLAQGIYIIKAYGQKDSQTVRMMKQ